MPATNPQQTAVALAYDGGESAPRIAAKGRGLVAEAIIARAREAGLYVHESPQLVALLMQVDLDSHIPQELYIAVAELLAWLYTFESALEKTGEPAGNPLHRSIEQRAKYD